MATFTFDVFSPGSVDVNGAATTDFRLGFPPGSTIQLNSSGLTSMTVTDDDNFLGGDNPNEQSADTTQQTTTITGSLENVYIDYTYTVQDSSGNQYTLYVIDVGDSPDGSLVNNQAVTYFAYDPSNPPPFDEPLTTVAPINSANTQYSYATLMCFVSGTRILTEHGEVPVERLAVGTNVVTQDDLSPIRWIGHKSIVLPWARDMKKCAPVRFEPGSIRDGCPAYATFLSPQHRVLLEGPDVQMLLGHAKVIAPAHALVGRPGVKRVTAAEMPIVSYFHILLDRHKLVFANGMQAETLFCGEALEYEMEALDGAADSNQVPADVSHEHTVLPVAKPWEIAALKSMHSSPVRDEADKKQTKRR